MACRIVHSCIKDSYSDQGGTFFLSAGELVLEYSVVEASTARRGTILSVGTSTTNHVLVIATFTEFRVSALRPAS